MARSKRLGAACLALVIGLVIVFSAAYKTRASRRGAVPAVSRVKVEKQEDNLTLAPFGPDLRHEAGVDQEEAAHERFGEHTLMVKGAVRSSLGRLPISAEVWIGDEACWTDPSTGQFARSARVTPSEGMLCTVSADGYLRWKGEAKGEADAAQNKSATEVNLGTIFLEPSPGCKVQVRNLDGSPASNAQVRFAPLLTPSAESSSPPQELATTDKDGECLVPCARNGILYASREGLASEAVLLGEGQRGFTAQLLGETRTIGMRDAYTMFPVPGASFTLTSTDLSRRFSFGFTTDATGMIPFPIPPGTYNIRPADATTDLATGLSPTWVSVLAGGEVEWVLVRQNSPRGIRVVDAVTGDAVKNAVAWLASYEEPPFVETPGWIPLSGSPISAYGDGLLSLRAFASLVDGGYPYRLYISAAGYAETFIEDAATVIPPGVQKTVALLQGSSRSIRLINQDGSPWRASPVVIAEWPRFDPSDSRMPDATGVVGPFTWGGKPIQVCITGSSVGTLTAAAFESAEVPSLVVPLFGTIEVECSNVVDGEIPQIECHGWTGNVYFPRYHGGQYQFEFLPAGQYEVGLSQDFHSLDLRAAQGLASFPIVLGPGQVVSVPCDPAWVQKTTIKGNVATLGISPQELFVVPRFGPTDLPAQVGVVAPVARVNADSTYSIDITGTWPSHLLFGRLDPQAGFIPLAACAPGEVAIVAVANVIARGPPQTQAVATLVPFVPGRKTVGFVEGRVAPGGSVQLGAFSAGTRLYVAGGPRQGTLLNIAPGEECVLQL